MKEPTTQNNIEAFSKKIIAMGGKIELAGKKGFFIISIDYHLQEEIRKMSVVNVVGGINVKGRKIPVIKVR